MAQPMACNVVQQTRIMIKLNAGSIPCSSAQCGTRDPELAALERGSNSRRTAPRVMPCSGLRLDPRLQSGATKSRDGPEEGQGDSVVPSARHCSVDMHRIIHLSEILSSLAWNGKKVLSAFRELERLQRFGIMYHCKVAPSKTRGRRRRSVQCTLVVPTPSQFVSGQT